MYNVFNCLCKPILYTIKLLKWWFYWRKNYALLEKATISFIWYGSIRIKFGNLGTLFSTGKRRCVNLPPNPHYQGKVNITRSGRFCQRWAEQIPHFHDVTSAGLLPDATIEEASNFCRTPSNSPNKQPWCFTTDPDVRWEPCAFKTRICRKLFYHIVVYLYLSPVVYRWASAKKTVLCR